MTNERSAAPVAAPVLRIVFLVAMGAVFCVAQTASQPAVDPQKMTDETVLRMVQAKVSPDLIILAISKCEPHFQLDNASMNDLIQQGVSEDILKAMAAKQVARPIPGLAPPSAAAPALSGDLKKPALHPKAKYNAHLGTVDLGVGGGVFIYPNLAPAGQPSVVTSASVAFNKYVAAYGEFAYSHLSGETGDALGVNFAAAGYLLDYGAGAHVTVPTGTRIVPYGTVGFGRSDLRGTVTAAGLGSVSGRLAAWNFNLGGGVKVFVTRNAGVDFDFRAYRPALDGYSLWYGRTSLGVFFQFNNKKF
jgi:hypothetical protein